MRSKQYLPLLILTGLVALYAQLSALEESPPTQPDRSAQAPVDRAKPVEVCELPVKTGPTPDVAILSDLQLVLPESGVRVLDESKGQALLQIDMKGHERLLVTAHFGTPSKDWSLDLGDSISNNGWGGDSCTNFHDAEVQILNGGFEVFASDAAGNAPPFDGGKRFLKAWPGVATEPGVVQFEVADGEVVLYHGEGEPETFSHDALFALDGQPDAEGGVNYDLFLGINRVVSNGRTGSGVSKLQLEFR